jgi:hypothetical protein
MSCCREILGGAPSNRPHNQVREIITTQPTAQPALEKPTAQPVSYQPALASPPPAIVTNSNGHGFNNSAIPPWGQAPSPSVPSQYGSPSPPIPSPPLGMFANPGYNPTSNFSAISQPQSAYPQSMSGQTLPMSSSPPLDFSRGADEGKMSVAVDFGEHLQLYVLCIILSCFARHYFLGCRGYSPVLGFHLN